MKILLLLVLIISTVLVVLLTNKKKNFDDLYKKSVVKRYIFCVLSSFTVYILLLAKNELSIFDKYIVFFDTLVCLLFFFCIYIIATYVIIYFNVFFSDSNNSVIKRLFNINYKESDKKESLPYLKKLIISGLFMFSFAYMLMIFGIFETYTANYHEWLFEFEILMFSLIAIPLAFTVIFALIISLLPVENYYRVCIFISSFSTFLYIQNAFLNKKEVIIGDVPQYDLLIIVLNTLLFVLVLYIPQILLNFKISKKKLLYIFSFVSLFLLFIQLAPLPFLINSYINEKTDNPKKVERHYYLSADDEYVVADEENIVVFILDTFSKDNFDEYLLLHDEEKERLKDFVVYENVSTMGLNTPLSMPFILTCSELNYDLSLQDSYKESWNCNNASIFYNNTHNAGYIVNLYTDSDDYCGDADNMIGKIDNIMLDEYEVEKKPYLTYFKFLKLSLFKYSPIFMKELFFVGGAEEINLISNPYGIASNNLEFKEKLDKGLLVSDGKRIIFYHLRGMHTPYFESNSSDLDTGRIEEEEFCLSIIYEYIDQLKKLNLYNSTCIIVTADHGIHTSIYGSEPMMAIKYKNANNSNMQFNSAPGVVQYDLLPTILDEIGCETDRIENGQSLKDIEENQTRERIIRVLSYSKEYKKVPKCMGGGDSCVNCYEEYRFSGTVNDIDMKNDLSKIGPIVDFWW